MGEEESKADVDELDGSTLVVSKGVSGEVVVAQGSGENGGEDADARV